MIRLNRLNEEPIIVNADLIERVVPTHEVVLILTTGRRIAVRQTLQEVLTAIWHWQHGGPAALAEPVEVG